MDQSEKIKKLRIQKGLSDASGLLISSSPIFDIILQSIGICLTPNMWGTCPDGTIKTLDRSFLHIGMRL